LQDLVRGTSNLSLVERVDHIDGGNINSAADYPSKNLKQVITELNDAHSSTAYANNGTARTYTDIDGRFEAIE
jgi:hypothetical protein